MILLISEIQIFSYISPFGTNYHLAFQKCTTKISLFYFEFRYGFLYARDHPKVFCIEETCILQRSLQDFQRKSSKR